MGVGLRSGTSLELPILSEIADNCADAADYRVICYRSVNPQSVESVDFDVYVLVAAALNFSCRVGVELATSRYRYCCHLRRLTCFGPFRSRAS